jgi:hypothetical protein
MSSATLVPAWERCRFLGKTLQLLSEWHLLAG